MNLRRRLILTVVIVAVPLSAGAMKLRQELEWREAVEGLAEVALIRMEEGGHEAVLRDAHMFPPPPDRRPRPRGDGRRGERPRPPREDGPREFDRPPPRDEGPRDADRAPRTERMELFAYARDFTSANRTAPEFPQELRDELESGASHSGRAIGLEDHQGLQVAIRTPWPTEEDAYVLATRRGPLPQFWSIPSALAALAIYLGVLGAVWFAAGPLVSRARRLEREVRRAAADRYAKPVELTGSDELTRLGTAFNEAGAALHEAIEVAERRESTLRRFVENTAHDVGTPLTVLHGHLANLQRGPDAEALKGAVEETQYIAALLGNLATAAQLEDMEAPPERHRVDLGQLIERVVARHRPLARERGVELEFATPERPVHVAAEVTLLERALGNPVHNAVQHGGDGGHVTVHLEVTGDALERFRLRVLDDGPGVRADQIEQLSERSWRGDAARQRFPDGHGLGLAIAREIADRHGFDFDLAPNEPTGLTVTFEGPLANEPA